MKWFSILVLEIFVILVNGEEYFSDIRIRRSPYRSGNTNVRIPGEISKRKCVEYGKYVYKTEKAVVLLLDAPDVTKNECAVAAEELVVGGKIAKIKEFPHMALIGFGSTPGDIRWGCGGSIISDQYILTASHCLESREAGPAKYVKVGITKRTDEAHMQTLKIAQRIPHPQYYDSSRYNDIGLLKLEQPIKLNPYARPACLYAKPEITTSSAIATGWGDTVYKGNGSNDLMKVELEIFSATKCSKYFRNDIKLSNGVDDKIQLCAGASLEDENEKDTCNGDSGSPLQIYHRGDDVTCMYDIIAVTSFGNQMCGEGKIPGVYTKISNYVQWIEDIVWP